MSALNGLGELFKIVLAASKDQVYRETVEKMQAAFQELILAEAEARRDKTATLIHAMAKIDSELIRFQREYRHIAPQLTPEAMQAIDGYLEIIEQKRRALVLEKNALKKRRG